MNERPLSVTVIAWIYIAVGVIGVVYHTVQFNPHFSPLGRTVADRLGPRVKQ